MLVYGLGLGLGIQGSSEGSPVKSCVSLCNAPLSSVRIQSLKTTGDSAADLKESWFNSVKSSSTKNSESFL